MVKKICFCDRCQKTTELPIAMDLMVMDIATFDVEKWPLMPERTELCEECAQAIRSFVEGRSDTVAIEQQNPPPTKTKQKSQQGRHR